MNFLTSIYNQLNNTPANNGTLYSMINYLVVHDDPITHIKKKEFKERFSVRKNFSSILELLIQNKVLKEEEDCFVFNSQARDFITPLLMNVLNYSYKDRLNLCNSDMQEHSPTMELLLGCRSDLYSSSS